MKKFFLAVFIIAIIGVQPVVAQSGQDESGEKAAAKGSAPAKKDAKKDKEIIININLASDDDIIQALDKAKDIELVNEDNTKKEENAKRSNKEGKK
jgi:hypothetical protein